MGRLSERLARIEAAMPPPAALYTEPIAETENWVARIIAENEAERRLPKREQLALRRAELVALDAEPEPDPRSARPTDLIFKKDSMRGSLVSSIRDLELDVLAECGIEPELIDQERRRNAWTVTNGNAPELENAEWRELLKD